MDVHFCEFWRATAVSVKNTYFIEAAALQSRGRNCSSALDVDAFQAHTPKGLPIRRSVLFTGITSDITPGISPTIRVLCTVVLRPYLCSSDFVSSGMQFVAPNPGEIRPRYSQGSSYPEESYFNIHVFYECVC